MILLRHLAYAAGFVAALALLQVDTWAEVAGFAVLVGMWVEARWRGGWK